MNLRLINPRLAITLFCATLLHSGFAAAETLVISDAWIREAPPTATVLAGYMRIDNPGAQEQTITGVTSPRFERIEMHRTEVVDGVARMLPQEQLVVPAGGSLTLEPGGLHLMLIGPTEPVAAGDTVTLRLQLGDDGNCAWAEASVKRGDDAGGMDHSQHHHHH